MSIRVGINGFGRMGRLTLRAAWDNPELQFVQINDPAGDAATLAHLLEFDSIHGRWDRGITADGETLVIDGTTWLVKGIRPDGTGLVELALEEQSGG